MRRTSIAKSSPNPDMTTAWLKVQQRHKGPTSSQVSITAMKQFEILDFAASSSEEY
jgi:hypothetical protein